MGKYIETLGMSEQTKKEQEELREEAKRLQERGRQWMIQMGLIR